MKPKLSMSFAVVALLALTSIGLKASDMVGVYCLVEKVVLEPNDTEPQRIQIWGAFALANGRGYEYAPAQKGYMFFTCPAGKDSVCWSEWADLRTSAGKGLGLGFGSRYMAMGHVRKADEKPASPETYPIQMGVIRMGTAEGQPAVMADLTRALRGK